MESANFANHDNSVKVCYIDPPYNTNSIKSYNDTADSADWAAFMSPRLRRSKSLLRQDGLLFVSIDDNEQATLKVLLDEVYGKENHLGTFITQQSQRSNANHINTVHEYILCYAKDKTVIDKFQIKRVNIPDERTMIDSLTKSANTLIQEHGLVKANKLFKTIIKDTCQDRSITWLRNYNNIDEQGQIYYAADLSTPNTPRRVSIPLIGLELEPLKTRGWMSDDRFIELSEQGRLVFNGSRPYQKNYLIEASDNAQSVLNFYSRQGTHDLNRLGLNGLFDTPKPVELVKYLIRLTNADNSVILDFFGGSGTTAQAVYELNEEDGVNNSFILIQKKEFIDKSSKVYNNCIKAGLKPRVDKVMIHRIDTYLESVNIDKDYEVLE